MPRPRDELTAGEWAMNSPSQVVSSAAGIGRIRAGEPAIGRAEPDWAIITAFSAPALDRFVRDATTFVPDGAGAWRRSHEHHENVLVDTSGIPALLAASGVRATVGTSFGAAELPPGLRAVTGQKNTA